MHIHHLLSNLLVRVPPGDEYGCLDLQVSVIVHLSRCIISVFLLPVQAGGQVARVYRVSVEGRLEAGIAMWRLLFLLVFAAYDGPAASAQLLGKQVAHARAA